MKNLNLNGDTGLADLEAGTASAPKRPFTVIEFYSLLFALLKFNLDAFSLQWTTGVS
jgi:hypothetical protein